MRKVFVFLAITVTAIGIATVMVPAPSHAAGDSKEVYVTEMPAGYRDWTLISVAREEGDLNDIRAVLGNDIAVKAYREKKPFPEGSIIARIAWEYLSSEENDKT